MNLIPIDAGEEWMGLDIGCIVGVDVMALLVLIVLVHAVDWVPRCRSGDVAIVMPVLVRAKAELLVLQDQTDEINRFG